MATFKLDIGKLTPEGAKYIKALQDLDGLEVAVGFQAGQGTYEDGTDLVEVVAYNEFGTSTIPPRPFMKQSFENHPDKLGEIREQIIKRLLSGASAEQAMNEAGVFLKGLMQEEIVTGEFVPNAPSTIKKKGSATPLIDTGQMRQSVNYIVRKSE